MKAAICYEAGEPLVIEEIKIQPPQDDEIRVKVRSCGICQSDQHYLSGAWSGLRLYSRFSMCAEGRGVDLSWFPVAS